MEDIEYWNEYIKPSKEVEVEAKAGDLVVEIGGILYLLQRENDCNNVICFRTRKSSMSTLKSFLLFREFLLENKIQYIRVEGNTRRYKFLSKVDVCDTYNVIQDKSISERNVFYIKLI